MQGQPPVPEPVVLDTNTVLDWLLFRDPRVDRLALALHERRLRWLATPPMMDELRLVLQRPLGTRWDHARERLLADSPAIDAVLVEPISAAPHHLRCTDASDQKFVDLALQCRARWLVTHDRALLALRRGAARLGLTIVRPQHWSADD